MSVYAASPADVLADEDDVPRAVGTSGVETVREEWLVEDRWWTPAPLRRHYFELALADGRCVVVFRELDSGRWFSQRG
ncbi:MAG TPA: hypothetical protein VE523_03265 [Solirubrobacterales bacterium]|jgi:hypothetical protein|nr:hypothetical protein [Solirubrobacterales bacterium]